MTEGEERPRTRPRCSERRRDGQPCGSPPGPGGRCTRHEERARVAPACLVLADRAQAIAARAPRGSGTALAARQLARVLRASPDVPAAARSLSALPGPGIRDAAARMLASLQGREAAADVKDLGHTLSLAWMDLEILALEASARGARLHDSDVKARSAGILAAVKAEVQHVAGQTARQLREAAEAAAAARAEQERAAMAAARGRQRDAEQMAAAFAGEGIADLTQGIDPHGYFVYFLWGDDPATPLYVGQSRNLLSRLGSHMGDPRKFPDVRRVTIRRYGSEQEMDRAEDQFIGWYQPPWNILGVIRRDGSSSPAPHRELPP